MQVSLLSVLLLAALGTVVNGLYSMEQVMGMKTKAWTAAIASGAMKSIPSEVGAVQKCTNGSVTLNGEAYPCDNIDLLSFLSVDDISIVTDLKNFTGVNGTSVGNEVQDLWGWLSPDGKEITISCLNNGVVFIDGTDPVNPVKIAALPARIPGSRIDSFWCDVKVYKNVAYVVRDGFGDAGEDESTYGVEVFDLMRLDGLDGTDAPDFTPDFVYRGHGRAHNVVMNVDTGYLYSVGNARNSLCRGGLHMLDLNINPLEPVFVGCAGEDGYTHDAQCVLYDGPDAAFAGAEICFNFNEDTMTIFDVTNKSNPVILSRSGYPGVAYTHQGALSADLSLVFLDDEVDELDCTLFDCDVEERPTTTYFFDVTSLTSPVFKGIFVHPTTSIDHNMYNWGSRHARGWSGSGVVENPPSADYMYLANYISGLRVIDISDASNCKAYQSGFFDTSVSGLEPFFGAWSNYMHPSGVIAVNSIELGVFFLNFTSAFVDADNSGLELGSLECTAPTTAPTTVPTTAPIIAPNTTAAPTIDTNTTSSSSRSGPVTGIISAVGVIAFLITA